MNWNNDPPRKSTTQIKDPKTLQELKHQSSKRFSLDQSKNPKDQCLQRIFSTITQYQFVTTQKQLVTAETMMLKLRAQILQYPKSLQGIMKFNSQFQTHLAKIFSTNDSDDGIAPLGRQLIGAHRGTKDYQDKLGEEIVDLNAVFKQWFIGFNNCKAKMKEREKCMKDFVHYFNKLPKLKQISSAQQRNQKALQRISRNQEKFKSAEVKLKKVHQDAYQMMQQILKNRYVLINPCILRFIRALRRYYSGCGGIFAQFVEDKFDQNQFDIPEADRKYNASMVINNKKRASKKDPSNYSYVISKAQVQEDGQIGGFKFKGFNNAEKKNDNDDDDDNDNDNAQVKKNDNDVVDEKTKVKKKDIKSVAKKMQKLAQPAVQSLAFRLSNNQVKDKTEQENKNDKKNKMDVNLDDFNSNLPGQFACNQFDFSQDAFKFQFQKPKNQPKNNLNIEKKKQQMSDSQNQKVLSMAKTDQQLQQSKRIGLQPPQPKKQPAKVLQKPKAAPIVKVEEKPKPQKKIQAKKPAKIQKKQQKVQEFNALPAHFNVFKNEQLPNYQEYEEEKKKASIRDQYYQGGEQQPATPVYDYRTHTYVYPGQQSTNDNYEFNQNYDNSYNNDSYQNHYNNYDESQEETNFRLKYLNDNNSNNNFYDNNQSYSNVNQFNNDDYYNQQNKKFNQGLAYAAGEPQYSDYNYEYQLQSSSSSRQQVDEYGFQRKSTIRDQNGHIARFGGILSNPQFYGQQEEQKQQKNQFQEAFDNKFVPSKSGNTPSQGSGYQQPRQNPQINHQINLNKPPTEYHRNQSQQKQSQFDGQMNQNVQIKIQHKQQHQGQISQQQVQGKQNHQYQQHNQQYMQQNQQQMQQQQLLVQKNQKQMQQNKHNLQYQQLIPPHQMKPQNLNQQKQQPSQQFNPSNAQQQLGKPQIQQFAPKVAPPPRPQPQPMNNQMKAPMPDQRNTQQLPKPPVKPLPISNPNIIGLIKNQIPPPYFNKPPQNFQQKPSDSQQQLHQIQQPQFFIPPKAAAPVNNPFA